MKYIKCTETDRSDCLDMHTTTIINIPYIFPVKKTTFPLIHVIW